jgi:hypothetical protein
MTNHYLTQSSSSDWTLHENYFDFQLNSVVLRCIPLYSVVLFCTSYCVLGTDPTENAVCCCQECVFIYPLSAN